MSSEWRDCTVGEAFDALLAGKVVRDSDGDEYRYDSEGGVRIRELDEWYDCFVYLREFVDCLPLQIRNPPAWTEVTDGEAFEALLAGATVRDNSQWEFRLVNGSAQCRYLDGPWEPGTTLTEFVRAVRPFRIQK